MARGATVSGGNWSPTSQSIGEQWDTSAGSTFGTAKPFVDILSSVPGGWGGLSKARSEKPKIYEPRGAIYYVSNSTANGMTVGSDSTGTGTFLLPWLTVDKALTSIGTAGDATIYVNDGTYSESSLGTGRFIPRTLFADWVSVESLSKRRGAVTITTASSPAGAINFTSSYSCSRIQFRNITIQPGTTQAPAINASSTNGTQNQVHFVECSIAGSLGGAFTNTVFFQGDGGFNDFALIDCEFIAPVNSGAVQPVMISVLPATIAGNGKYTNFSIWGCRTTPGASYAGGSAIYGVNGLIVVNNMFTVTSTYGFLVGSDASTNAVAFTQTNVLIRNNYFNSIAGAAGHGLLIGFGCQSSVIAENNWVLAGYQGIVIKGANGPIVRRNTVIGTPSIFLNGIYVKASQNVKVLENFVHCLYGSCFREDWDNTTSVSSGNTTLMGNQLIADGSSALVMTWANTPDSTGGAMSNYNVYELRNGAAWGLLRSHTLASFADLQAGWATYGLTGDLATNDSTSQQNTGNRNDIVFTTGTGKTLYIRLIRTDGTEFNGWAAMTGHFSPQCLYETATAGTYAAPVPFNLPSGQWCAYICQVEQYYPKPSDPIIAQVPVAYAS